MNKKDKVDMKKFMLRGYEKEAISEYLPKSLKYNTWYHYTSPFESMAFKLKKGKRHVHFYEDINDNIPYRTVSRNQFLEYYVPDSKGNFKEVFEDTELGRWERELVDRVYRDSVE